MEEEVKAVIPSDQKEWKTFIDDDKFSVQYWDGYKFLGKQYRMEEIETNTELGIVEVILDAGIVGFASMNDLTKIDPLEFIHKLIKSKGIYRIMALLLKRVDDGQVVDSTPEEFEKGRAKHFHPFVKEVIVDFFYLNSEHYGPIIQYVKSVFQEAGVLISRVQNLTTSTSSAKTDPPSKM